MTRRTSSTRLLYRSLRESDDDTVKRDINIRTPPGFEMDESSMEPSANGINYSLLKALYINQAANIAVGMAIFVVFLIAKSGVGALGNLNDILRWTGDTGPPIWDLFPTGERLLYGLVGVAPLLVVSHVIEQSDNRAFSNVNLSTITLVLTMFGRRTAPPDEMLPKHQQQGNFPTSSTLEVALNSACLALVIGLCEESVFRRLVPAGLAVQNGVDSVPANLVGAAVLFALGHWQPKSGLGENSVTVGLQLVNGVGFGSIYLFSGGDLVPCIIAHAAYDFVNFFKTWNDANDQMEYAERKFREPLSPEIDRSVQQILRQYDTNNPRVLETVKMLFFTFDFDKNGSLSLSEVRKGLSYHSLEQGRAPPPQAYIDKLFEEAIVAGSRNRMTFPDFLRLTLLSSSTSKSNKAMAV